MPSFKVTLKRDVVSMQRATMIVTADSQAEAEEVASSIDDSAHLLRWVETNPSDIEIHGIVVEKVELHAYGADEESSDPSP